MFPKMIFVSSRVIGGAPPTPPADSAEPFDDDEAVDSGRDDEPEELDGQDVDGNDAETVQEPQDYVHISDLHAMASSVNVLVPEDSAAGEALGARTSI